MAFAQMMLGVIEITVTTPSFCLSVTLAAPSLYLTVIRCRCYF